ncbi:MAG: hypothetical protein QXH34_08550 [Ignisphaera sp.]
MSTRMDLEVRRHAIYEDKVLGAFYRLLVSHSRSLALYVDFSPLRYPLIKILITLTAADDQEIETGKLIGTALVEMVLNIESLYRDKIDFDKDIVSVRLACEHGWITYEYTVLRSEQGIPYASKLWMHMVEGKPQREIIEVNEEFIKYVDEIVRKIVIEAKKVLEDDGYI